MYQIRPEKISGVKLYIALVKIWARTRIQGAIYKVAQSVGVAKA